jgi:hypothetical protein
MRTKQQGDQKGATNEVGENPGKSDVLEVNQVSVFSIAV